MKELAKTLATEFKDKEYAHAYLEDFSNMEIAAQIKALREQRGLTQKGLAVLADMKQERISALEDVDYDAWTAKTLRKLAWAFDVSIKISFETISSRIMDVDNLCKKELERISRDDDLNDFGYISFTGKDSTSSWGEAVQTSYQRRAITQPMPANDSWHNLDEREISANW